MDKKSVLANAIVALLGVFFAFIVVVWPLPQGVIIWALALLPFLAALYWRYRVFPVSGFSLIRFVTVWVLVAGTSGALLAFSVALFIEKVFGISANHGLGVVLMGGGTLLGIFSGVLVGVKQYKRSLLSKT